jgi:2,7-dihydroxy-5-methyl-1-naphthoate 7-O-methyltransferase
MAGVADLEALSDLCTPWCLRVVVTLRIADRMAAGTTATADLAEAAGCDRIALGRVLGRLADRGVFERAAEGEFALNDAARALLDPGLRLGLDLEGIGGRLALAWGTLPTYVRTGAPGYHELFGMEYWEDLAANPEIGASFDALMGPMGHGPADPEILAGDGWRSVRTVVDVGGGTGAMLAAILAANPPIRGTLVDLPGTVARSPETFAAAGVADRVTTIAQSFFDPLPAGADVYVLRKVINDWPDPQAVAILRRCAEALGPGGRVIVIGGVSPQNVPTTTLTEEAVLVGGRERTVTEFRELARQAGLDVTIADRAPSGAFVVQCSAISR